ncbi:MAG TPA: hypothetical protein VGI03_01240 [Verrucomicrobiae bacterium]
MEGESFSKTTQAQGKQFTSEVTWGQLMKTPVWSSKDNFPAISPRQAEKAATAKFRKFLKYVKSWDGWKCTDITLDNPYEDEHWDYIVVFGPVDPDRGDLNDSIVIVVLMDGTVIEPSITDVK